MLPRKTFRANGKPSETLEGSLGPLISSIWFEKNWAGVCGMHWPQTGHPLFRMVYPHLFFFFGNRLYRMVVHNPVVNIPAEKNDKFPVLPRKTFRANGKPSETLEGSLGPLISSIWFEKFGRGFVERIGPKPGSLSIEWCTLTFFFRKLSL